LWWRPPEEGFLKPSLNGLGKEDETVEFFVFLFFFSRSVYLPSLFSFFFLYIKGELLS
jgi:hypothetical protein